MSHPERLTAHMAYMRVRAAALRNGDEEAQRHAVDLEREAQEIERHIHRGERGGS